MINEINFPTIARGSLNNIPDTPVFTHFTSARRRYAPHDVAVQNKNKI